MKVLRPLVNGGKGGGILETIGWREWVGLPDLGVKSIKAKVDTGARSSSLHVRGLELEDRDGVTWASFDVYPAQRGAQGVVRADAKILEFRSVRSSSGKASKRPVIVTCISLMGVVWLVDLTLANRDEMGFRMLLGREAFRRRFLVDAGRSFLGGRPKKKTKKVKEES